MHRNIRRRNPQDSANREALPERIIMDLKLPELRAAGSFLRQARLLVNGVASLFSGTDKEAAVRLNDIERRLGDEVDIVDRQIAQAEASKH
jgi:hypothetical protein